MLYFIGLVALLVIGYILYTRSQSKPEAGVVVDQAVETFEPTPYKVEPPVTVAEIADKAEVVAEQVPAPVVKTARAKPTAKAKTTAKATPKITAKGTANKPRPKKTVK